MSDTGAGFWDALADLVARHELVLDRPAGSAHPRFPDFIYPLDYGYLDGTTTVDGGGVDVWLGTLPERRLVGAICTVDRCKADVELKLLVGCTAREAQLVLETHRSRFQAALLLWRPDHEKE